MLEYNIKNVMLVDARKEHSANSEIQTDGIIEEGRGQCTCRLLLKFIPRICSAALFPDTSPPPGPVFVDVYGHLGIDSKNRFRMKN